MTTEIKVDMRPITIRTKTNNEPLTDRENLMVSALRKNISSYFPLRDLKQLAEKGAILIIRDEIFLPEETLPICYQLPS
jgi:hypothetical protein